MISSMESVKSLCDFIYMDEEECREGLARGELAAGLLVPEDLVSGIMDGTNTPITVLFPRENGLEGRIFEELTQAGAATLGAGQAGIYAGDELLISLGMAESVAQLEKDLNQIYLSRSLPRLDYFGQVRVNAAGDVDTMTFYGISMAVFFLLLCPVPVSGFLEPLKQGNGAEALSGGNRAGDRGGSKNPGPGFPACCACSCAGCRSRSGGVRFLGSLQRRPPVLVCLAAASVPVFLYQAAGGFFGGVILLFGVVSVLHFMAGGFLPLVFLPRVFSELASFNPCYILMEGLKMAVTARFDVLAAVRLAVLAAVCFAGTAVLEEVRRK